MNIQKNMRLENERAACPPLIYIMICAALLFFICCGQAMAGSMNRVRNMETTEFDRLIKTQNKPCLVIAMAAWCAPCRKELPILNKLYKKYKSRGLRMIGMGLDLESPTKLQEVIDELNVKFPVYWIGEKGIHKYKIHAIPVIFFMKNGKIVEKVVGERGEKILNKKIEDYLK